MYLESCMIPDPNWLGDRPQNPEILCVSVSQYSRHSIQRVLPTLLLSSLSGEIAGWLQRYTGGYYNQYITRVVQGI